MDTKDLKGLMEAYSEVYAPEQLDELSVNKMLAYGKAAQKDRDVLNKKWDEKKASQKEKMRVLGHEEGEDRAAEKIKKKTGKYPHQMNALDKARYAVTKEELDIFDVVLEFLQTEGYAETLEEAEWMMANVIDEEAIDIILGVELEEGEGSYGQTPKASAAYTALYTGKGKSKTKSLALKHAVRSAADRYNSDKPYTHRSKMTQSDRDYHRGQSENRGKDREGIDFDEFDTGASGPGGMPKGKKLERQRKRGVSAESYDIYDIILTHLLDEGYAETPEAAEAIMVNMSEEWRDDIMEISDRKVKAVRNAREKQWNKQFGKNRVQDPTDDMTDKIDKLIDQRNKRTGSNVKKTTMGQLHDKNVARRRGEA